MAAVVLACVPGASAVIIETVPVGNPGNAGELSGSGAGGYGPDRICGAVGYVYNIGKYEVTNSLYKDFLNDVAKEGDPNGLYNMNMGGGWNDIGGISRTGLGTQADPWVYSVRSNRANRPVNYVSWYDAIRFANWMTNGDTESGSYTITNGGVDSGDVVVPDVAQRTQWAQGSTPYFLLPSEDEWYKAAYYKGGGTNAGYWDYPTESDTAPTAESPPGTDLANGSANCYNNGYPDPTYYTTVVGAYSRQSTGDYVSDTAYDTFDQAGNLWEWNEADIFGDGSVHGARGGSFSSGQSHFLHASCRLDYVLEDFLVGLRVAYVPEPASLLAFAVAMPFVLKRKRKSRL